MTDKYTPAKSDYLTLQGKKYLPARRRVQWFRGEHPDWTIHTSVVELNWAEGYAIIRGEILDDTGRLIASGMKSETRKGFADFVEKAETGAIARAVAIAGYGTEDALDLDEGERIADGPVQPRMSQPTDQQLRNRILELVAERWGGGTESAMKQLADEAGVPKGERANTEQLRAILARIEQPSSGVPTAPADRGGDGSGPLPTDTPSSAGTPGAATAADGAEGSPPATAPSAPATAEVFSDPDAFMDKVLASTGGTEGTPDGSNITMRMSPPAKPGTSEYRAYAPQDKANARAYWQREGAAA